MLGRFIYHQNRPHLLFTKRDTWDLISSNIATIGSAVVLEND
jgi:hypothetical protein